MHPSVERRGALFTAAAGPDPYGVRDAIDGVAQTYFLLDEEPRNERNEAEVGAPPRDSCLFLSCSCHSSPVMSGGHHLISRPGIEQGQSDGSPPWPAGLGHGQFDLGGSGAWKL